MQISSELLQQALRAIERTQDLKELEAIRLEYLGKKGKLTELLKNLSSYSSEERPLMGQAINSTKVAIQEALAQQKQIFEQKILEQQLKNNQLDINLPAKHLEFGHFHPMSLTLDWIKNWFASLGFVCHTGPEIETDYYNFEALNIPPHHPARNMHDTFYFPSGLLLRTHTSPVQIRVMENEKPPIKVITPGRVYRYDLDATHTPQFHQIEVLMVDKGIHFGNLKYLLQSFLNEFFGSNQTIRFRSSYFPFTEVSAEIDILDSEGKWLEILGCGMVHPKVLQNVNIDPEVYTGFALGMGIERLAMLRYNIPDIRYFYENDSRFLSQF